MISVAAELLLGLALKSTLVLIAAMAAVAFARRLSAAERHLLWLCGLLGLPVLLLVGSAGPRTDIPLPSIPRVGTAILTATVGDAERSLEPASETGSGRRSSDAGPSRDSRSLAPAAAETPRAAGREPSSRSGYGRKLAAFAVALYSAVALLLLVRFFMAVRRASREVRALCPVSDAPTLRLAEQLRRELRVARPLCLKHCSGDRTPWAWGLFRPVVALPERFEQWPATERRAALMHEIAHLARIDFATTLAAHVVCALFWFNPLAWFALERVRRESEHACDDVVIAAGGGRSAYAGQLVALAENVRNHGKGLLLCAPMAGRSAISERIASILDLNRRRKTVNKLKILAATAVTVAFVAPLATLKSQETATAGNLGDADFEAILANGPADDEALEAAVRGYLEDEKEDGAAALLEAYIWKHGANCGFCSRILRGEGMGPTGPLQNALSKAFDGIEGYAEAQQSGQLLLELAVISAASGNRNASNRGLFYLMEGFRLGNLDDEAPMRAIGFFNLTNRYEEGLALARKVYSDPASSLYQAKALEGWLNYFENMAKSSSVITERLLSALGQEGSSDGDYLPIYKQSPVYPKDAASQGVEGTVVVEFVVTESGRTRDVKVVSSTNSLFDDAAVEAASQFLYAPRIVGGVPVEIQGVRNKINFVLESHG